MTPDPIIEAILSLMPDLEAEAREPVRNQLSQMVRQHLLIILSAMAKQTAEGL